MINTPYIYPPTNKNACYGRLGNKYILLEKIGRGATSSVFSAIFDESSSQTSSHIERSKVYAIKICKKNWNQKTFLEEGRIMKYFSRNDYNNFNIIMYYETGKGQLYKSQKKTSKNVLYHVFELAENFELFDYIHVKGFGEKFGRILFSQILNAVQICHERGIVHKDIKTENILLNSDYQCKLADFGLSMEKKHKAPLFSLSGTDGYFPPEALMNKPYDLIQCDIFALGVCLFIIVCGTKPFCSAQRLDAHYRQIWRGKPDLYWKDLPCKIELTPSFKQLIIRMFSVNPEDRPTLEEIRKSKWMTESEITNEDKILLRKEFELRRGSVEEYRKVKHSKKKNKKKKSG